MAKNACMTSVFMVFYLYILELAAPNVYLKIGDRLGTKK
jgi:hypothetical protein